MRCPTTQQHQGHQISINYSFLASLPDPPPPVNAQDVNNAGPKDTRQLEENDDIAFSYVEGESLQTLAAIQTTLTFVCITISILFIFLCYC